MIIHRSIALIILLCAACAIADLKSKSVQLHVAVGELETAAGAERVLILTVANHGSREIAIVKPALPAVWRIVRTFDDGSGPQVEEFSSAIGSGAPDPGYPRRYRDSDYERIPPGSEFRFVTPLDFFLSNGGSRPLAGSYRAVFWYEHAATSDEADLPLCGESIESNELAIKIAVNHTSKSSEPKP